jgi:hypothetical protein
MLNSIIPMAFFAERYMITSLTFQHNIDFAAIFSLFFNFGLSLIVLKFLKKGFDVYIGWNEGDPDADPLTLVVNFLKAVAIAVCFPILYETLIEITEKMLNMTIGAINALTSQQTLVDIIVNIISDSILQALAGLTLIICYAILWLGFMARGVEMLVMRAGLPIACVGLLDSSQGIFQPFMKKFFQNAATVLVQAALVKMSLTVMIMGNLFYSIAIALVAMRTPKFLQEFFIMTGGGGSVMNTVYHTSRLYQMAKGTLSKTAKAAATKV